MKSADTFWQNPLYLLAVDLEPAPYKIDLWNAFALSQEWQVEVLYTNAKDISKDAGHNYQELPVSYFAYRVLSGHSLLATIVKVCKTISAIMNKQVDLVFISGYVNAAPLAAILACAILRKPFFVHSDIFNLQSPRPPLAILKRWLRDSIRTIIFRFSKGVLVCGKLGYESALLAGCPAFKVIDFPYVVERERLLSDTPISIPFALEGDVGSPRMKLYFSGRMIERKGLTNLLEAAAQVEVIHPLGTDDWIIWISGDGSLLNHYQQLSESLGIAHRVRFLGFVQMSLHSWLMRHADIVLVPSLSDAWGIAVDEAMQLGKAVIASSGVGSAIDRINPGKDGLLFDPGNTSLLKEHLIQLMTSSDLRISLGQNAMNRANKFSPKRNVRNLTNALGRNIESSK